MVKILEVKPIYKGNYNMTPEEYEQIMENQKRKSRFSLSNLIYWILISICCSYLVYAIVR